MKNWLSLLLLCFSFTVNSQIPEVEKKEGSYPFSNLYRTLTTRDKVDSAYQKTSHQLKSKELIFLNDLGYAFVIDMKGDHEGALDLMKELNLRKEAEDPFFRSEYFKVMGNISMNTGNPEVAVDYFQQAVELSLSIDDITPVNLRGKFMALGVGLNAANKNKEAMTVLKKALAIPGEKDEQQELYLRLNIALTHSLLNDKESAKKDFKDALSLIRKRGDQQAEIRTLGNLANIYLNQDSLLQAKLLIEEASELASSGGFHLDLILIERQLSKVNGMMGNYRDAYLHLLKHDSISNALNKPEDQQKITAMEMEHRIQEEKLKAEFQQKMLKSERSIRLLVSGLLVLSLVAAIVLTMQLKKLKEKNEVLLNQNLAEVKKERETPRSSLLNDEVQDLINELLREVNDNKIYTEPDLSLDKLAKKLQTNRTYLSEAINSHFGKSFSQLLNEWRIKEARKMLANEQFDKFSIEGIALQSGFSSLSAFNANFKKLTGLTPSFFRKNRSETP